MEGENQDVTPDAGTTTPEPTQPQTDPAAPQAGTTEQDDQQGTTGDQVKAEKEPLYQTRYQQLVETLRAAGIDPETLGSTAQAGSLANALQGQQQPQQQEPNAAEEQLSEFDPYDPEQMKNYLDHNFGVIRGNLANTVRDVIKQVRQEEQFMSEFNRHQQDFDTWAGENKIPQEVINKAVQQYQTEFGNAGTPAAFVRTVKAYIKDMGYAAAQSQQQNAAIKDAVEKAKALDAAAQPAPGTAPAPGAEKKTWQEQTRDTIAPPDPEPEYT